MAHSRIIRIPRTDSSEDGAFVLGEVSLSGSKPLNLKVVATEGQEPYVVKLKHDHVDKLRVNNSPCSSDEWESILKAVLLGGEPVEGIEAGAEVQVGKSVTITIRRRVAGINQRLGTITLSCNADEAIELFDWCGSAIQGREELSNQLVTKTAKVEDLESRVTELRKQLDELTQAKKANEAEMLEKFCLLLNEKKVKVREQQRLLSAAIADPARVAAVVATRPDSSAPTSSVPASSARDGKGRAPKASRASKRKNRQPVSSDDSDDGFEKMDVDKKPVVASRAPPPEPEPVDHDDSDSDEGRQTPGNDDTETGSGSEEEEPLPPVSRTAKGKGRATASPPTRAEKGKGKETLTMQPRRTVASRKSLSPPPATAAITRHRAAATATTYAAPATPVEDSETESDDEL